MSTSAVVFLLFFAMLASGVQRVSGFGFGIVMMALLPYLLPSYGEATALSGLLALVTAMITAIKLWKCIPWKKMIPILLTFLVSSFFFVGIVAKVDSDSLKKVLGAVLVMASLYFFFISGRFRLKPTLPLQLGMGTLSGAMGGLFAMHGPPAVIYFISSSETKEEYTAMTQCYFFVTNIMLTAFRAANGFVTATVFRTWLLGIPAVLLGLYIGGNVYGRIRIELLRKIVYAFLAVSGAVALFS